MPAKRIIILDRPGGGRFRYALWADVPAPRQAFYAAPGRVSAWSGASAADNTALATGAVVEKVDLAAVPPAFTLAQTQTYLEGVWADYQAEITATNLWNRYGSFWDGTTWTAAGAS